MEEAAQAGLASPCGTAHPFLIFVAGNKIKGFGNKLFPTAKNALFGKPSYFFLFQKRGIVSFIKDGFSVLYFNDMV
ncbi:MAG TPA: hypothetical protein PKY88_08450 [Anaerohalosphaeraceae bacterium]|nr:hypothetical protein [Anaerohalosphaeraceae bacterium]